MRKGAWLAALLALAAACGDKKQPSKTSADDSNTGAAAATNGTATQQPAKPDPAEVQARIQELKRARTELEARVQALRQELADMEARHEQERSRIPSTSELRRMRGDYTTALRDFHEKRSALEKEERRFEEVTSHAESAARDEIKQLREELKTLEAKRAEINDAWKRELAAHDMGAVEESPVKLELHTLRAVKSRWFEATPAVRAGRAAASEQKIVNDSFRAWLKENEVRSRVVKSALEQDEAPKGKTLDTYDFTSLDFYVLMELLEDTLDRQNIAREKKLLSENKDKLDAIEVKIDGLNDKLNAAMVDAGDEFAEYEDLADRLPDQREAVAYLAERLKVYQSVFDEAREIDARQEKERANLEAALEAAEKDLKQATAELRRLAG